MADVAIADALGGAGRLLVVEGSAGIGKSSLLAEARGRAADAGMTVLSARGSEIERAFSYGVVRQLFERRLADADEGERSRLLEGAAAHAARLFLPGVLPGVARPGEDEAFALIHGLYWLALNLAEDRPLLVSIDDLQWSDGASLRWVAYLARRLEGTTVGVLCAVRPIEDEDPVLAELLADPAITLVKPSALSVAAVTELVRGALSPDAEATFCRECHRVTGGNPLLLRELVRSLAAEGVVPSAGSVDVLERLAPDAVARSVRLRLARLPADAAALARAVAVLGDGANGRHAAALAGVERRSLAPAAALLARVDLLEPDPPLRFVHPLVRNSVYEASPAQDRAHLHARAAEVLGDARAPVEQVAGQLLRAPPESVENAVVSLRAAGHEAAARGAPASAASYLRRALEEPMTDPNRAELLLELAAAESSLGAPTVIDRLSEAADLLEDPESRARAELELGRALYWAGREEEGVQVLQRALHERSVQDDLGRRLQAEFIANAARLPSHYEDAWRLADSVAVKPEEGPGARILLCVQAYGEGARGGDRARAVELAGKALAAMSEEERAWNYTTGCYAMLHCDRLEEAIRFLDPLIQAVQRRGAVFNFSSLSMTRALIHYGRGALGEAEADGRAALEVLPHKNVWFVPHAHAWLAQILVERGELDEASELLGQVAALLDVASDPFSSTPVLRARAMLASAQGNHGAALEASLDLGRALAGFGHTNPAASHPAWRSLAAFAHYSLGETEAALALAREEVALARSWAAPRTLGRSLRILGLVEGGTEGIERIREAVSVLDGSPARLEHSSALVDLGAALRRGNRRAEAREFLRSGLELAQRLGATVLRDRAHEELVATGARPRRLVLSGVDSLTPSERRIAAMAAEGLSNREIAQALFVTLRTVEMHLSNAFRKLDVSSRTQLPAALASSPAAEVTAQTP
ncbi:MAG: AAA family ATPase [Solirubrobacterales bacterium]|nr:AAA family ATPase [Solirubrobacterales bacterium]